MSGIVLSSAVRQNLLSLQSTAALLSTTQNDLATGNAVNTALDNPSSYFTAEALNNRASDINNLLDGIGNGVQVLQAANTGITSLQGLISNAQSVANQVLQTSVGYDTKSSVTSGPITGATADNLLGTQGTAATVTGGAIGGASATTVKLSGLSTAITSTDSLTIDGKTISFTNSGGNQITSNGGSLDLTNATVGDLLAAVDTITGATNGSSTLSGTKLVLSTGTTQALTISGAAGTLTALGLTAGTTALGAPALSGQTLIVGKVGNGLGTSITFGTSNGQISTLNALNTALAANNLQASIDSTGAITITTSNDAASATIGAITGTSTTASTSAFYSLTGPAPVADANSQAIRTSLVNQYNQVLQQINNTAVDSSYNGINLLNGDTLGLTFDETGASTVSITGVTFNDAGLGLSSLKVGIDFLDSNSANAVLSTLTQASTVLRTEASSLGSNLSVVEIRQDFNKSLINVLQTGASNLTLADPNQEAANSQALSTRQSIAVSALALANQSQQSVLQLLR